MFLNSRLFVAFVGMAMLSGAAHAQAQQEGQAEVEAGSRERYRWTGAAGDGRWSTFRNWERWDDEEGWTQTENVPTRDSEVVFGDAPSSARQHVDLNYHTEVGRVLFKATGSNRVVRIRSWLDPNDTGIDSDSGMLYSLRLSDSVPITQAPEAAGKLIFDVEVVLTHPGQTTIQLLSEHAVPVAVNSGLMASGDVTLDLGNKDTGRLMRRGRPYKIRPRRNPARSR